MVEFEPALKSLTNEKVDFVVVDEIATLFHLPRYKTTGKLDFCYSRTPENLKGIVAAFDAFNPLLRGFPNDLPFAWNE